LHEGVLTLAQAGKTPKSVVVFTRTRQHLCFAIPEKSKTEKSFLIQYPSAETSAGGFFFH
jgi:hypothetical protein